MRRMHTLLLTPLRRSARPGRARSGLLAGLALLAGLTVGPAARAADASAAASPSAGALSLASCQLPGLAQAVRCGMLRRPVDPAQPQGPAFDLHVAVLPAVARHKLPDPVFFFAGGPGQSATELASTIARLMGRFSARRDVVLIDQRGTGRSAPLHCDDPQGVLAPLARQFDPQQQQRDWAACRQALAPLPLGDLRHLGTSEAVADAEAVRQALGLGPVNLVGVSYGTRMVLEYQRRFPQQVRRAVLDGVAPGDMVLPRSFGVDPQAALQATWAACAADPACQARHPQLQADWQALLASLPRAVTVNHPWTGQPETLTVTAELLQALVRPPLYQPALAAALPHAVAEARAGRFQPLFGLAAGMGGGSRLGRLATGMHFGVVCAEDLPRLPPLAAGVVATGAEALYRSACAGWSPARPAEGFGQLSPARQAVLLLSGGDDPVTPPRHAQRVAESLGTQARHRVVAHAGHGTLALGCVRDLVFRFVDAADDAGALAAESAAGECGAAVPRAPFFHPPVPRAPAPATVSASGPAAGGAAPK